MDEGPRTEILNATYRALCERGYADLTLQDIATEAERSKASIHYHYDTKEELFTAFLDHLYDRYMAQIETVSGETAREQLRSLFDTLLADGDAVPGTEFHTAMLEVKAQAPYNEGVQTKLTQFDEALLGRIQEILADGIETGEFDDSIEHELVAEFLTTAITGARTRGVVVDRSVERLDEMMIEYVETHLIGETTAEVPY
ncbi:TetR/AcrR family transcriptional regulator [Halostella sp. PRR32]|uniref:TetR/AcrR family transcriptional regulator n=1 Tax=Halostella sp. PRR32 TaxID=3098147 RepID=UPI002B1D020B|nr:TetR/AcrR family transcriptional regulator [Halostella sp. PRR32]